MNENKEQKLSLDKEKLIELNKEHSLEEQEQGNIAGGAWRATGDELKNDPCQRY